MADIKFPRKSGEVVILTREICELWQKSNKLRNPITNRVLTSTSKIIKDIDKQCSVILAASPPLSKKAKIIPKATSPPLSKKAAKPSSPLPLKKAKIPLKKKAKAKSHKEVKRDHVIGDYEFVAEPIYGDGSCFFHSVIRLLDPNYSGKKSEGIKFRNIVADSLTFDDYLELSNGLFATLSLTDQYDLKIDPRDDLLSVEEIIRRMPNYEELHAQVVKNYKNFVKKFKTSRAYANEDMVDFVSKSQGVNIVILSSVSGRVTAARRISKRLPTIFLYNLGQYHYEPLVGKDGKTIFSWADASKILAGQSFLDV
jgi:hypothetical protein